jgi:hypothetical protein
MQQNTRGSTAFTSLISSPPLGAHVPGALLIQSALIAASEYGAAPKSMHKPGDAGTFSKSGSGKLPHVGSWYAEIAALQLAPIGSPHSHGEHSIFPSVPA